MKTTLFITCILATLAVLANSAQHGSPPKSPAPAPSVDCSDVAFDMLDCVTYFSDGNAEKPTDSCCAGFEAVLSLDDECLCFALKHSADFGVAVNLTRAAALSSECGVSAPPLSRCGTNTPSSAPDPAAPSPFIEPPTNDQPSAPAPAPSNSDDNGRSAAAPVTSDAPAKGTANAVSAPSLVLISSAVASALSLFLWI
ncbi:non-specific lipid-transfer protein-like protein [Populus alba x Populus x berolinensis]|uniref:Non-specific lipid-transfer protein-like protein n=1 Tax=Populus alba x Populus x berolinensis TaxID=444605 RepID=A0AAD6RD54_9ROSI|nr:non-specific lipid-transfer protein-like protein [Populus alba x Populus x berolinensis]